MCHVISGGCGCKASSSGVTAQSAVATLVGLAGLGLASIVMKAALVPLFGLYLVALALASRRLRRALLRALRWLAREMWRSWTTRHDRPAVGQAMARTDLPWRATLSAITPAGTVQLATGPVIGWWDSVAACEADVIDRALRAYAEQGERPPGLLCCRAEPPAGERT